MKILVKNDNNLCAYAWPNTAEVEVLETHTTAPDLIISDMTNSNATLYENVTLPSGFAVNKYFYDGTDFTLNDDYVSPEQLYQEMLERQGLANT